MLLIMLKEGKEYPFVAERETELPDRKIYWILISGPNGKFYTIPKKYYVYYNITPGKVFKGRIIKYS
ncbi:MAG: hypothetical protein ACUVTX_05550, partial [Bacteroidales bacterium]